MNGRRALSFHVASFAFRHPGNIYAVAVLCAPLFERVGALFHVTIQLPLFNFFLNKLERSTRPVRFVSTFWFSHSVTGKSWNIKIIISLPLGQYNCGPFSLTDHDHSLCMSAPIDAPSDIPMFFFFLSFLSPDLPFSKFLFFLPTIFVTYSQPSHEYCRESYHFNPSK